MNLSDTNLKMIQSGHIHCAAISGLGLINPIGIAFFIAVRSIRNIEQYILKTMGNKGKKLARNRRFRAKIIGWTNYYNLRLRLIPCHVPHQPGI